MILTEAAKLCRDFCAENEEILSSHSFESNSMEHSAIRFIQRVAAVVQPRGCDQPLAEFSGEIKTGVANEN